MEQVPLFMLEAKKNGSQLIWSLTNARNSESRARRRQALREKDPRFNKDLLLFRLSVRIASLSIIQLRNRNLMVRACIHFFAPYTRHYKYSIGMGKGRWVAAYMGTKRQFADEVKISQRTFAKKRLNKVGVVDVVTWWSFNYGNKNVSSYVGM